MKSAGRVVTVVVVAVFAAFWVINAIAAGGPVNGAQALSSVVAVAVFAAFWVVAARLIVRAWKASRAPSPSGVDGPARLLAAAVSTLPVNRRAWGAAMAAELGQVPDPATRWQFAFGCARTALFPPRAGRVPVLPIGAIVAGVVIIVGLTIGNGMRVFAVTFATLLGTLALLALARRRRLRGPAASPSLAVAGIAAVVACVGVLGYVLAQDPGCVIASTHCPPGERPAGLGPGTAVFLAFLLAGGLWLALNPPRVLTTSRPARWVAIGAALLLGAGVEIEARTASYGVILSLFFVPIGILFVAAAVVAAAGRSFRAGMQTAVWTALLGILTVFAIGLFEALRWYEATGSLLLDGEETYAYGVNIVDFSFLLGVLPLWWLPFGVMGASLGSRLRRAPAGPVEPAGPAGPAVEPVSS